MEKRQDCPRSAVAITIVKMVSARIVEVDRALDQPQPEQVGVEVQVTLRIAGDGGDVMESTDRYAHTERYSKRALISH